MEQLLTKHIIMLSAYFAVAFLTILLGHTYAVNNGIFPPDSQPYGLTYGEWTAKWWKWYSSIPQESNPGNDETGQNCSIDQKDANVWFLAGTGGGSAERSCTIPSGRAILFPIINMECSHATDPLAKTETEMRACAMSGDEGASVQADIEGKKLQELDKYRTQSSVFNVTIPENNVFGVKSGSTPMLSEGWWVLLEPLSVGKPELSFSGVVPDNPITGTRGFATEVTYHLP